MVSSFHFQPRNEYNKVKYFPPPLWQKSPGAYQKKTHFSNSFHFSWLAKIFPFVSNMSIVMVEKSSSTITLCAASLATELGNGGWMDGWIFDIFHIFFFLDESIFLETDDTMWDTFIQRDLRSRVSEGRRGEWGPTWYESAEATKYALVEKFVPYHVVSMVSSFHFQPRNEYNKVKYFPPPLT